MELPRASGILLHPTSLPGRFGIGDLGPEAHAFVDFLAETGQTWWQMLPLGPTGFGNSPYQSPSSFAGNPLLISPMAGRAGLARRAGDAGRPPPARGSRRFRRGRRAQVPLLRRAFERFQAGRADPAFEEFSQRIVPGWTTMSSSRPCATPTTAGPGSIGSRSCRSGPGRLARWRELLADGIRFHEFVQYAFETQWQALRAACKRRIQLIGDVPIFVAHDSADVWAHPELYYLDEHGRPRSWPACRRTISARPASSGETRSIAGRSMPGTVCLVALPAPRPAQPGGPDPDRSLPRLRGLLGGPCRVGDGGDGSLGPRPGARLLPGHPPGAGLVPLIAEDLGVITPDVEELRDEFNLPGMRVIQFGFDADPGSEKHLPHRYVRIVSPTRGRTTTTRPTGGSTRPRHDHPAPGGGGGRAGLRPPYAQHDGRRDSLGPDPHGLRLGRRYRHHPRCRTSSGSIAAPDELPRQGRGELAMAVS